MFTRLTVKEGLNSNHVFGILQDRKGFMWFAGVTGLQRYDGLQKNRRDLKQFNDGNKILSLQRAADKAEVERLRAYYGF